MGRKHFFSEEKKQKTFVSAVADPTNKSFLVLFFKKGLLPCLLFLAAASAQPPLPTKTLTIVTRSGARHAFTVEMATTPQEQQIGEMFRTNIPADHGMFFDWGTPRDVPMWMKNCPVPEDMVFIGSDGIITHIAENTVPESLANISSGGPVRATLELRGGITAKLDIGVGDRIEGVVFGAVK